MSAKHTKGPWRYDHEPGYCGELIAQDGTTIAEFVDEPSLANARRIVACVNACDGIPTAWLEGGAADILEHSIALIKQRNELLEALQLILTADQRGFGLDYIKGCARGAIAKAESNITT